MIGRRMIRRFLGETRAAALVEFTLVFPFLLVMAAGASELGFALHQQHVIQKSVRDAARYAARTPFPLKSCPLSSQPKWTQMVADTTNVALRGKFDAGAPFLLPNWTGSRAIDVQVTETCFDPNSVAPALVSSAGGGNNIPVIKVEASAQFAGVGMLALVGLSGFEIRAEHSEMWTGL